MTEQIRVYDLGAADDLEERPIAMQLEPAVAPEPTLFQAQSRPGSVPHPTRRAERGSPGWDLTGSLSLFVPGAGQIVRHDPARGAFFLSAMAFLAVLGWAGLATVDRTAGTLELFGYAPGLVFWALIGIYAMAALVHLGSVLDACPDEPSDEPHQHHPVLTGAASALVPGWGQILNNDRIRAGLFLGILWIIGAAWLLLSSASRDLLASLGLVLPEWARMQALPLATWMALAVTWSISVYDAAASAAGRRQTT